MVMISKDEHAEHFNFEQVSYAFYRDENESIFKVNNKVLALANFFFQSNVSKNSC